ADHRHAFARVDLQRGFIQQRKMAVGDGHAIQGDERNFLTVPRACAIMWPMTRIKLTAAALVLGATVFAQPRLTFDYSAMAKRIVQQLALKPGERVMSLAHPGTFEELQAYTRYGGRGGGRTH